MSNVRAYWYPAKYNVGDTLTPHILEWVLGTPVERVAETERGTLLAVGSVMKKLQRGDTVWGTGVMRERDRFPVAPQCEFLAVRGPLTRAVLLRDGARVSDVYGDPALLLPLMYQPTHVEKRYEVGVIPHYVDQKECKWLDMPDTFVDSARLIPVSLPWREFVQEVLSCQVVYSSSLHGIIIAEAYGIPCHWMVWSDKVIGKGFKFRDYLASTDRRQKSPGELAPIPAGTLIRLQQGFLASLRSWYQARSA